MGPAAKCADIPGWAADVLPGPIGAAIDEWRPYLRSPAEVMAPSAMRAMARSRLSFANTLIERMVDRQWTIRRTHREIDGDGIGFIAYEIDAEGTAMHFGAFCYQPLPLGHQRLFRDTKTDFFGALVSGPVDVDRLRRERKQFDDDVWRGRTDSDVYGWTVASRGTRTFENVVDALAAGRQPDRAELDTNGGYIMRNGGYYGNGRMGTRAWQSYASDGAPLSMPYHIDLFCLYLWRLLSFDVADAAARARNPDAATLAPDIKRSLGIGNSSGLGTVAALVRWPARLSAFVTSREVAFAYAISRPGPVRSGHRADLVVLLQQIAETYARTPDPEAAELVEPRQEVAQTLTRIGKDVSELADGDGSSRPWAELIEQVAAYGSAESVDLLRSAILELYPETADLRRVTAAGMARDCVVQPEMTCGDLRAVIEAHAGWSLRLDLDDPSSRAYFWYRSEENGENRRGERAIDVGAERETFIDVAGTFRRLYDALADVRATTRVGEFLLTNPEHTLGVARAQLAASSPYSEIQASVCAHDFKPSDAIRCFLSVLGIELPAPHSARWVRGVFHRDAPLPDEHGVVGGGQNRSVRSGAGQGMRP